VGDLPRLHSAPFVSSTSRLNSSFGISLALCNTGCTIEVLTLRTCRFREF
jgi:hypothetical protein